MIAIKIKYLAPTNTKGARLKAICSCGSITQGKDYSLDTSDQALLLAKELINKMEWPVDVSGLGVLPNGDYVVTIK